MDSIREELVMSLTSYIGAVRKNILHPSPELCKVVMMSSPIISDRDLDILRHLEYKGIPNDHPADALCSPGRRERPSRRSLDAFARAAEKAVDDGYNYLVIATGEPTPRTRPFPRCWPCRPCTTTSSRAASSQIAVIVESGEVCETMHVALLMGYGASGVNPYMAFAILKKPDRRRLPAARLRRRRTTLYQGREQGGMLKIMSKMGISTIRSYRGAALFSFPSVSASSCSKALHGRRHLHDRRHRHGGCGTLAAAVHARGFSAGRRAARKISAATPTAATASATAGTPPRHSLQRRRARRPPGISPPSPETRTMPAYAALPARHDHRGNPAAPSPWNEVRTRPRKGIMRRFVVEAMSFGAISREVHENDRRCHEPHRRPEQHGRRRRGSGAQHAAGRATASLRSVVRQVAFRRYGGDHAEYRHAEGDPDQGGPGGQARRGRPAPGASRSTR